MFILVLLMSGLLLVGAAVIGVEVLAAKHDLVQARTELRVAQSAVAEGDQLGARTDLARAQQHARRARQHLTGWLWDAYSHVPIASPVVREVRGVVAVTDAVTSDVLQPLIQAAPSSSGWSGRADLDALRRASLPLATADNRLTVERARLAALPVSHVRALDVARDDLGRSLEALAVDLRDAAVAANALPTLLGSDRPSTLLVVAQNLAEERATGGLIGSYALVRADRGRLSIVTSGTDADLPNASHPVVDLGPDFQSRYGQAEATSTWLSANLTPDVPSAGRILAALSASRLHVGVDAVVFVDPVALSHVLRATGPVNVDGVGAVSGDNAVSLLQRDIYARYRSRADQNARKQALRRAFDAVVLRLQRPVPHGLARELVRCVATGHLFVYSTDGSVEAELKRSRVSGALPSSGPFLSLVTQDVGGSKLDYYLHRSVSYTATPSHVAVDLGVGPETVEDGVITIQLRNDAPTSGLPPYVTARADQPGSHPAGQLKTWLSVYLGPRSTYLEATLDGRTTALASEIEGDLTVLSTFASIDPGDTLTLRLKVQQPAGLGAPLLWRQQPRDEPDALQVQRGYASDDYRSIYDPS